MNGEIEAKTELRELMNKSLAAMAKLRRQLSGRDIIATIDEAEALLQEMKTFVEPEPEKRMDIA